ncbi:hypothetical protein [Stenotrophomonas sp.]|jgi:hypothetical protein|uniref:hypothetical protein n=1 Tax=Stenotrophomonas sp. TaxID=69392 RepID=UPI0025CC79F5|nr:hypothetical protein [Stenotrophomonas sp.]MBW8375970.1 hypothetical protein [Stenotrophomonas sp.]
MAIFRVGGIEWECDGKQPVLPVETTVECEHEDDIAGVLSDRYGWLVSDFVILEKMP